MIENSVIDITEDPNRLLLPAIKGNLSEIIGKTKTWLTKIGGYECAPVRFAGVPVNISPQGLPKRRGQFRFFVFQWLITVATVLLGSDWLLFRGSGHMGGSI